MFSNLKNTFRRFKRTIFAVCLATAIVALPGGGAEAQVFVDSSYTVDSLVNTVLLGSCVVVSNVTYRGAAAAVGYFNAQNTNIGLEEGVIISTGNIANARGPDDTNGKSTEFGTPGDADLTSVAGVETNDAAVLEFDFISSSDTVKFNYVFASEEYPEYVGQGFNDVFVFYVSGPDIIGQKNIALIPNTSTPVTIDNVNAMTNAKYFVNNAGGASIQYDGFTVPMEAKIGVTPGATYHMKIAIADAGIDDLQTDSGVFLEAGSFRSGERITIETVNDPVEGCREGVVRVSRKEDATDTLEVTLIVSGTAQPGKDFVPFPTTVRLLPGEFTKDFIISAIQDSIVDPGETIVLTLDNKCIGTDPSVDVVNVLEDGLKLDVSRDTTICRGTDLQFHATVLDGAPPFTYQWVPDLYLDDDTIFNPVAAPPVTTTYTVTVFDSYGCSTVRNITVTVDDLHANAGTDARICYGASTPIGVGATGGTQPYTFRWLNPGGLTADSIANPVASPLIKTEYVLEVTGANGCVDYDTVLVDVGARLNINVGNDTMVCAGTGGILRAVVSGGTQGYVYTWSPAAFVDSPTLPFATAFPENPTMFYLTVVDREGCTGYDSIFVDVNYLAADAGGDKQICAGASIQIGGQPRNGVPPYSYLWSPSGGLSNANAQFPIAGPAVTTDYIVRVLDDFGCVSYDTMTVVVGDIIKPDITADGPLDLCEGESVTLEATPGYAAYLWSTGETTQSITVSESDTVRVTVSDNFGCQGTSDSVVVIRHPLPEPEVEGPNAVCLNSVTNYNAVVTPGNTYSWLVTGGNLLSGQNTPTITVSWNTYGTGTVQLTETAGQTGCSQGTQYEVDVADELTPRILLERDPPWCAGDTVRLNAPAGYSVYQWSTGSSTQSIDVVAPGNYTVYVELDPQCTGTSEAMSVVFEPLPTPVISPDGPLTFCEGDSVTLDAGPGYVFYNWSNGAQGQSIIAKQPGQYAVTVINTNGCEGTSPPVTIQTVPLPAKPGITRAIDTLYTDPAAQYQWFRNDTLIQGATGQYYVMMQEGIYTVQITVASGCSALSDPFEVITPLATSTIMIPDFDVDPGERFTVPVIITQSNNLQIAGVDEFTLTLRFNRSTLFPIDGNLPVSIDGDDILLEMNGFLGSDTLGVLTETDFMAMLGFVETTPLHIESFRWVNNFVRISPVDGQVRLGICREGGDRLFEDNGAVALAGNHPNPFNATTILRYSLIEHGHTDVFVLDALGRRVATLESGMKEPGSYTAVFDATALPSGMYIAVLRTPTMERRRLMEVIK